MAAVEATGNRRALYVMLCLAALVPPLLLPGAGALLSLLLVGLVLWRVGQSRQPTLDWRFRGPGASIAAGLAAALAIGLVMQGLEPLIERTFGAVDLEDFSAVEGNLGNYLALLALGLLFGGIVEELIFRGYVIGWGTRLLGERAQYPLAILSAAIFGITHLYQGWGGVVETGLIGLFLGLLYVACGRKLLPCIVAHMASNFWGITQIYLGNG